MSRKRYDPSHEPSESGDDREGEQPSDFTQVTPPFETRIDTIHQVAASKSTPPQTIASLEDLSGPELEAELRKRVEERMKAWNSFYSNLAWFVGFNLLLFLIWGGVGFPWPLFVAVPWGIGVVTNAIEVYRKRGGAVEHREQQIRREVEMERARLGLVEEPYEKPKRGRAVRLSDDGELVPVDEDEETDNEHRQVSLVRANRR